MITKFFDFDETINKNHTCEQFCAAKCPSNIAYSEGKKHAQTNTKNGMENFLKHDDEEDGNTSAIVTFHDNPNFIAGYIAHILGKELQLVKCFNILNTAINEYCINGIKKPFYISYIPNDFPLEDNKNLQLTALHEVLLENKWIKKDTLLSFYDDSSTNCNAAKELRFITSYLVKSTKKFKYQLIKERNNGFMHSQNDSDQQVFANLNDLGLFSINNKQIFDQEQKSTQDPELPLNKKNDLNEPTMPYKRM